MGNVPHVDLAGAELLVDLRATSAARGIEFRLAETHGEVRAALRRLSHAHAAALAEANQTVDDVLPVASAADRSAIGRNPRMTTRREPMTVHGDRARPSVARDPRASSRMNVASAQVEAGMTAARDDVGRGGHS